MKTLRNMLRELVKALSYLLGHAAPPDWTRRND